MRHAVAKWSALLTGAVWIGTFGFGALDAHEIAFDRSTVRADDYVTLSITLEGEFTGVDRVQLPLENLTLVAGPSSSTEFRWLNGRTSKRRVLSYQLRPGGPGAGAVGPVVVTAPNGDQLTLKRVTLDILDPIRSQSPLGEEDLTLGRLPAVVVEVSTRESWVGEQIEIRWSLYGENIRGVQPTELPSLDGFWVEPLEVDETTREVLRIGGELVQRQTLRHALIYPLRPGTFEIEPMAATVRIYRRDPFGERGSWDLFGGNVVELTRRSQAVTIEVAAPPDPLLPVGDLSLSCSEPRVPAQGPVAIDIQLTGAANLRAIEPPRFSAGLGAKVELESLPITVRDKDGQIVMQRGWRYLLFPREQGTLGIPPIELQFFDPVSETVRFGRCGGWTVPVRRVEAIGPPSEEKRGEERSMPSAVSWWSDHWIPATLSIAALLSLIPLLSRRARGSRETARILMHLDAPRKLRSELESWLVQRGHHPSKLQPRRDGVGDAWRAVSSLLDLVEREPWQLERARPELKRRILDLVEEIER